MTRLQTDVLILFQTNGQCNNFNSIEQLKSRPAHLAAFLHHVISQFDPAPVVRPSSYTPCLNLLCFNFLFSCCLADTTAHSLFKLILIIYPQLCYLYADLYKQTNSKETRRVFMDLHTFFIDRGAVSTVFVPHSEIWATRKMHTVRHWLDFEKNG